MYSNLPIFETERLILREIRDEDFLDMYEYASLPYIGPQAGWEPHTSYDHTRLSIKLFRNKGKFNQLGVYSIILKSENKMIGTCELHTYTPNFKAELGYTINPNYWGCGYAVEAGRALIEWGFETLNLKRIECNAFTNNTQSLRVAQKLGFVNEGIRRKAYQLYNGYIGDLNCNSMIDEDYYKMKRERYIKQK